MEKKQFELKNTQEDFRAAFKLHSRIALDGLKARSPGDLSTDDFSYCILLFYAVECGLKYLVMFYENINDDRNVNFKKFSNHDFEKLFDSARFDQFNNTNIPIPSEIPFDKLHLMFRYKCSTLQIKNSELIKIVDWLKILQRNLSNKI